jgi:predicted nucleic acid-binding protein
MTQFWLLSMMRATSCPVIRTASPEVVALDASAMVDLLTGRSGANRIRLRLRDTAIQVPAHFDAEVVSALGRLSRGGQLTGGDVAELLGTLLRAPFARHQLQDLIEVRSRWPESLGSARVGEGVQLSAAARARPGELTTAAAEENARQEVRAQSAQ